MQPHDIQRWFGYRVDDVHGRRLGRLCGVYCDTTSGEPVWLLVRTARVVRTYHALPPEGLVGANRRLWTPYTRAHVRRSAPIPVSRPVAPVTEARLCRHYGIAPTGGALGAAGERRTAVFALAYHRDAGAWDAVAATRPPGKDMRGRSPVGAVAGLAPSWAEPARAA